MTLGDRIRQAREHAKMSQAELARRIGLSKNAMNAIEAGETDPRASRITAIAKTLQVSTDSLLLGRQGEGTKPTATSRAVERDDTVQDTTHAATPKRPRTRQAAAVA
jgi:transcriptional regulator with XRE-family HTH domain